MPTKQTRGFRRLSTRFISCRQLQTQPTNVWQKSGKYKQGNTAHEKRQHFSWDSLFVLYGSAPTDNCIPRQKSDLIFKIRNVTEELPTI